MTFRTIILFATISSSVAIASFSSGAFAADRGLKVDQVYKCAEFTDASDIPSLAEALDTSDSIVVIANSNGVSEINYYWTANMTDYQHGLIDLGSGVLKLKSGFSGDWSNAGKIELGKMNGKAGLLIRFNQKFDGEGKKQFCYLL